MPGVTAAGVPAYEQIRKERMRARAQRAAVDAAVAMRVTMNDALDPGDRLVRSRREQSEHRPPQRAIEP